MLVCLQFKFFICSFPLFPNHSLSSSFSRRTSQICPHCFSTKLHISHSPVYVLLQFAWHILKCLFCTGYISVADSLINSHLQNFYCFCGCSILGCNARSKAQTSLPVLHQPAFLCMSHNDHSNRNF